MFDWFKGKQTNQSRTEQQHKGARGEQQALFFLQQNGLLLVTRNYRCSLGEIDLVMRDGNALVFVEVRLRGASSFGRSEDTVNRSKQQKVIRAAQHYLTSHSLSELIPCRFDVVAINPTGSRHRTADINWIQDAFSTSDNSSW